MEVGGGFGGCGLKLEELYLDFDFFFGTLPSFMRTSPSAERLEVDLDDTFETGRRALQGKSSARLQLSVDETTPKLNVCLLRLFFPFSAVHSATRSRLPTKLKVSLVDEAFNIGTA